MVDFKEISVSSENQYSDVQAAESDPEVTEPEQAAESDPEVTEPEQAAESDPEVTEPEQAAESDPEVTEPEQAAESDPEVTEPEQAAESDPEVTEPEQAAESDPEVTEPEQAAESDPEVTEPEQAAESDPEVTEPEQAAESDPEVTEPEQAAESDPEVTEPEQAAESDPEVTEPEQAAESDPEVTEPEQAPASDPEVTEPEQAPASDPEVTEPEQAPASDPEVTEPEQAPASDPEVTEPEQTPASDPEVTEPEQTPASDPEVTEPEQTPASDPEVTEPEQTPASDPEVTEPEQTPASDPEVTEPEHSTLNLNPIGDTSSDESLSMLVPLNEAIVQNVLNITSNKTSVSSKPESSRNQAIVDELGSRTPNEELTVENLAEDSKTPLLMEVETPRLTSECSTENVHNPLVSEPSLDVFIDENLVSTENKSEQTTDLSFNGSSQKPTMAVTAKNKVKYMPFESLNSSKSSISADHSGKTSDHNTSTFLEELNVLRSRCEDVEKCELFPLADASLEEQIRGAFDYPELAKYAFLDSCTDGSGTYEKAYGSSEDRNYEHDIVKFKKIKQDRKRSSELNFECLEKIMKSSENVRERCHSYPPLAKKTAFNSLYNRPMVLDEFENYRSDSGKLPFSEREWKRLVSESFEGLKKSDKDLLQSSKGVNDPGVNGTKNKNLETYDCGNPSSNACAPELELSNVNANAIASENERDLNWMLSKYQRELEVIIRIQNEKLKSKINRKRDHFKSSGELGLNEPNKKSIRLQSNTSPSQNFNINEEVLQTTVSESISEKEEKNKSFYDDFLEYLKNLEDFEGKIYKFTMLEPKSESPLFKRIIERYDQDCATSTKNEQFRATAEGAGKPDNLQLASKSLEMIETLDIACKRKDTPDISEDQILKIFSSYLQAKEKIKSKLKLEEPKIQCSGKTDGVQIKATKKAGRWSSIDFESDLSLPLTKDILDRYNIEPKASLQDSKLPTDNFMEGNLIQSELQENSGRSEIKRNVESSVSEIEMSESLCTQTEIESNGNNSTISEINEPKVTEETCHDINSKSSETVLKRESVGEINETPTDQTSEVINVFIVKELIRPRYRDPWVKSTHIIKSLLENGLDSPKVPARVSKLPSRNGLSSVTSLKSSICYLKSSIQRLGSNMFAVAIVNFLCHLHIIHLIFIVLEKLWRYCK